MCRKCLRKYIPCASFISSATSIMVSHETCHNTLSALCSLPSSARCTFLAQVLSPLQHPSWFHTKHVTTPSLLSAHSPLLHGVLSLRKFYLLCNIHHGFTRNMSQHPLCSLPSSAQCTLTYSSTLHAMY